MNTFLNIKRDIFSSIVTCLIVALFISPLAYAEESASITVDQAFEQLSSYQYGQDLKPLLTIEHETFRVMNEPASREKMAARLGTVLTSDQASHAAKQFACLMLRQVGTENDVPTLRSFLTDKEMRQDAYLALYQIPGKASTNALRKAFAQAIREDDEDRWTLSLLGFVEARRDVPSRDLLIKMVQRNLETAPSTDLRLAAIRTLGKIADAKAEAMLLEMAIAEPLPTPKALTDALLDIVLSQGKAESTQPIFTFLTQPQQKRYVRHAAFTCELDQANDKFFETLQDWLASKEKVKQNVALASLSQCSKKEVTKLLTQLGTFSHPVQVVIVESASRRYDPEIRQALQQWTDSDDPQRFLLAIQLGLLSEETVQKRISKVLAMLSGDAATSTAAEKVLLSLPRKKLSKILLDAFQDKKCDRVAIMQLFAKLRLYDAIDPLLVEAAKPDAGDYQPALDTLAKIADPDKNDLTRLLALLDKVPQGKQADAVQRTILIVCNKATDSQDRSALVLTYVLEKSNDFHEKLLPLLGRLGGKKGLAAIEGAMSSEEKSLQDAAVRAICNWPDASVADRLMAIVETTNNATHRRWALRAYVRVVTLKSDRQLNERLAMLQKAMKLATHNADRCLVIERAGNVRTMETVRWIVPYLENQATAESAAKSILDLAHHKFLRNPNKAEFNPLFEAIGKTSKDPQKIDRANRYRLGM